MTTNAFNSHNSGNNTLWVTPLSRQRISAEDSTTFKIADDVSNAFRQLNGLWDRVHMDAASRAIRLHGTYEYVHTLLREIISDEEKMVNGVSIDLDARRKNVSQLRSLFKLPPFDETPYAQGSIALLKAIDSDINELKKKREDVLNKQGTVLIEYKALCHRMGEEVSAGVSFRIVLGEVHENILSEEKFAQLTEEVKRLRDLFAKRLEQGVLLQSEAKKLYETIQLPANKSIGEEDMRCLNIDLRSKSVALSEDLLKRLTALNRRLKNYHRTWAEQATFRYAELLVKLDELAAKCFQPPVSMDYPPVSKLEHINGRQLQQLEDELKRRQEVYGRTKSVFEKLAEWKEGWKQKLDFERARSRASFYKQRAGVLQDTLKQQKTVEQKLPTLFSELRALCDEYVKGHSVFDILVESQRADKHAEAVMRSHEDDRQKSTGRVRGLLPHNGKRKASASVTGAEGARRKRSMSCDQLSAIYPRTRSVMFGPKTSSPKPE